MNISIRKKRNIILGGISTFTVLLLIETIFSKLISNFFINHISDNFILFITFLGIFSFMILISVITGYFITGDIRKKAVFKAVYMSCLCTYLVLFIISNIFSNSAIFIIRIDVKHRGYFPILPHILVSYGINILNNILSLFLIIITVYYIFFITFLEKLYQKKIIIIKEVNEDETEPE